MYRQIRPNTPRELALGPTTLLHIASGNATVSPRLRIVVPDTLLRLIFMASEGSQEHIRFLQRIAGEFHKEAPNSIKSDLPRRLRKFFDLLRTRRQLIVLTSKIIDPNIARQLANSFLDGDYDIALSEKRNFLRDYYVKVISWSKRTAGRIVENAKEGFERLEQYVACLKIPDRADVIIKRKKDFFERHFSFPGGKATRWFIATAIAVPAAFLSPPHSVAIAVLLAIVDP